MSLISDALSAAAINWSTVERQQELSALKLDSRKCRHANGNLERLLTYSTRLTILLAFAPVSVEI